MASVLLGGRKLTDLRVVDLRQELENRGLEKSGVKAVLIERLQKVICRFAPKNDCHVPFSMQIEGRSQSRPAFLQFYRTVKFYVFPQALDQEEDVDEETAEFIPIDSIELTGDEEEDAADQEDEEQLLSSPLTSPKRSESVAQKQAKKTSITPILSK